MSVLYLVVPLAMLIVAVAVGAYVWASESGQMDDLDTPALRVLHDDVTVAAVCRGSGSASAGSLSDEH